MSGFEMCTDEQLIRRLRDGERKIMDYIMEKYKNMVRKEANAVYLLGGETDDLIQEGMIGLFKAVQDFDEEQKVSFYSFAKLCIRRQMYTAVRASNRKKHLPLNSYISIYDQAKDGRTDRIMDMIEAGENSDPEAALISRESLEGLENALEKSLSELEHRVMYLHLLGTDYKTIAKLLHKSPKAIDNALQRIKGKVEKIVRSQINK